jgi:hypothetical protein
MMHFSKYLTSIGNLSLDMILALVCSSTTPGLQHPPFVACSGFAEAYYGHVRGISDNGMLIW